VGRPRKGGSLWRTHTAAVLPDSGQLWRSATYLERMEMESDDKHLAPTGPRVEASAVAIIGTLSGTGAQHTGISGSTRAPG